MKKIPIVILAGLFVLIIASTAISLTKTKERAGFVKYSTQMPGATGVVLTVNGKDVNKAEYLSMLKLQESVTENLLEEKDNLEKMPEGERKTQILKEIEAKLGAGQEVRTFSYFITNCSLTSEAEQNGLSVSIEEAKLYAKDVRKKYENDIKKEDSERQVSNDTKEFINAMGEDYYWNEYVPEKYQRTVLVSKLKEKVTSNIKDETEKNKAWKEFVKDAVNKASVQIKDSKIVKVTIDEVLNYKNSYPGF